MQMLNGYGTDVERGCKAGIRSRKKKRKYEAGL